MSAKGLKDKQIEAPQLVEDFKLRLGDYKSLIDADIEAFTSQILSQTGEQFGQYSLASMEVFCDVLGRGGKRIRGSLSMLAYEMFGGSNSQVAIEAARVMEIIQTYLLVVDDVYDRSRTRRGRPSAHILHQQMHQDRSWKDDSQHFGETMAFNSGLVGCHLAMTLASRLQVRPELVARALEILNTNLRITGEGQANDVYNEVTETADRELINNVLTWKTAYYTFVNPLQFGAVLAGASDEDLDNLLQYSIHAGRAFQITDDILGIYGSEFESGKSPMDDIREGKRTLLTYYTLRHASKEDSYFLSQMLGNQELTQAEFRRCKDVVTGSGAYDYALEEATSSVESAIKYARNFWGKKHKSQADFLIGLVEYLLTRKS